MPRKTTTVGSLGPSTVDGVLGQHGTVTIEDHKVGRSIALAGDDSQSARLDREVGDERITDHHGRCPFRQIA